MSNEVIKKFIDEGTIDEILASLIYDIKPLGYIPETETLNGEKLYVFQYSDNIDLPPEQLRILLMRCKELLDSLIKNVIFVPESVSVMRVKELINQ